MMRLRFLLIAVLFASATSLLAQQQLKVAGATSSDCTSVAKDVAHILGTFAKSDTPQKWTWVVVCDADSWDQLFPNTWSTKVGTTQPETKFTYLNGSRLALTVPQGFTRAYVVAHELGHIMTGSSSEKDADRWAKARGYEWGKRENPRTGIQAAHLNDAAANGVSQ